MKKHLKCGVVLGVREEWVLGKLCLKTHAWLGHTQTAAGQSFKSEFALYGSYHWILRQPDHINTIDSWPGGPKSYLWQPVITSSVIQQNGTHQCGVLMVITG